MRLIRDSGPFLLIFAPLRLGVRFSLLWLRVGYAKPWREVFGPKR